MLVAAIVSGFLMGFLGSMPPAGPIAVLVLQRGVVGKYRDATAIAVGAAIAEGIYCALATFGFAVLFEKFPVVELVSRIVGVLILLGLGVHFVRFKPPAPAAAAAPGAEPAPEVHHGALRAALLGFSISAANPVLIVTWSTSVAMLYSLGRLRFDLTGKVIFATSVLFGIFAWFSLLLALLRKFSDRMTLKIAQRLIVGAGIVMLVMGLFLGVSLLWRSLHA